MANYVIPANQIWVRSGFRLEPSVADKTLTIVVDATNTWMANPNPGGGGAYNAQGWQGRPAHVSYKVPGANEGTLVGQIEGTAILFTFDRKPVVRRENSFVFSTKVDGRISGELLFGINDENQGIGDNQGSMIITEINVN